MKQKETTFQAFTRLYGETVQTIISFACMLLVGAGFVGLFASALDDSLPQSLLYRSIAAVVISGLTALTTAVVSAYHNRE